MRRPALARRDDASDANRRRNDAGGGLERGRDDNVEEAQSGHPRLLRVAVLEDNREFVAGVAGDEIHGAEVALETLRKTGDHLVARVIAIGAIEREEIFQRDQHHGEWLAVLLGLDEKTLDMLGEVMPVEDSREGIELRLYGKLSLVFVPFGDDPQHAMGQRRATILSLEPATRVIDPDCRRGPASRGGIRQYGDLIGNAASQRPPSLN